MTGNVEVHYHIVDKDGNVIVTDAIDFNQLVLEGSIGELYDSIPVRYQTIQVNGKTYQLLPKLEVRWSVT